jgi:hypothetical protein
MHNLITNERSKQIYKFSILGAIWWHYLIHNKHEVSNHLHVQIYLDLQNGFYISVEAYRAELQYRHGTACSDIEMAFLCYRLFHIFWLCQLNTMWLQTRHGFLSLCPSASKDLEPYQVLHCTIMFLTRTKSVLSVFWKRSFFSRYVMKVLEYFYINNVLRYRIKLPVWCFVLWEG